jgi:hypothetical protein
VTQTSIKREDKTNWLSSDVEYKISNSSDEAKQVTLLVPFNTQSDSKVQTKMDYSYTKGNFVTFSVLVQANRAEKFDVHFESKK